MLSFTFLGTASGVPTRQRNVSGLAVQTSSGPDWFLIDAGEGTQHRLLHTRLSLHALAAICITHVHGDHCYGLPGLLESAGMAGRTRPLTLIAPAPVRDWLRATRRLTDAPLPYAIEFVDVAARQLAWESPGLRIERHVLRHRVPSHAYSVQVETQRARLDAGALHALGLPPGPLWKALQTGKDVAFNAQTLHSPDFVTHESQRVRAVFGGDNCAPELLREACTGAQVLVHEATFTQAVLDQVGRHWCAAAAWGRSASRRGRRRPVDKRALMALPLITEPQFYAVAIPVYRLLYVGMLLTGLKLAWDGFGS